MRQRPALTLQPRWSRWRLYAAILRVGWPLPARPLIPPPQANPNGPNLLASSKSRDTVTVSGTLGFDRRLRGRRLQPHWRPLGFPGLSLYSASSGSITVGASFAATITSISLTETKSMLPPVRSVHSATANSSSRQISVASAASTRCLKRYAFCASGNFIAFIYSTSPSSRKKGCGNSNKKRSSFQGGGALHMKIMKCREFSSFHLLCFHIF